MTRRLRWVTVGSRVEAAISVVGTAMGTTLALCGAACGWGVMVLITRRRVAVLRLRCADAEAENARWRQAHSGRLREPDGARAAPREWERAWEPVSGGTANIGSFGTAGSAGTITGNRPDFAERAFVNIGRRVQSIVHRQLGDLGEMQERHGGDPAVFADLMRLDHGTALIGRLADSLVVLAGERPGRQWTEPVPVFSVLRGAMSRIVDYRRVELAAAPDVELAGTAVEAVVHALAELLDNATRYSPPDSRVILTARRTVAGVVIEVVDAGVGMAPQAAEHVARVLADPGSPGLDLADVGGSPRLGLAVIGRLAHTVGFQATVRPSAAGGVKAQLQVPKELVLDPAGASHAPAPPQDPSPAPAKAAYEKRSAGLPQRRRRAPAVETAETAVETANGTAVGTAHRTPPQDKRADTTPEPGQWLDAFRGDPSESPTDNGGAAS